MDGWGPIVGGLRVGACWGRGGGEFSRLCPAGVFRWGRAVAAGTWGEGALSSEPQPRHGKRVRSVAIYKARRACARPAGRRALHLHPVLGLRTLHSAPLCFHCNRMFVGAAAGSFRVNADTSSGDVRCIIRISFRFARKILLVRFI